MHGGGNVIDSFLIALGFKIEKEGLEEFEHHAHSLKGAMLGVAAAAGGAAVAIFSFAEHTVGKLAGIAEFSEVTKVGAKEIAAMGKVATENGGSLEGMEGTIRSLSAMTGQAALGIGRATKIFQMLGLRAKDAHGKVKDVREILGDVADKMVGKSRSQQLGLAARLGIDEHLLNLLEQGREKWDALVDTAEKENPLSEEDYENALKTEKLFNRAKASMGLLANQIAVKLLPTINDVLNRFIAFVKNTRKETWERIAGGVKMTVEILKRLVQYVSEAAGAVSMLVHFLAQVPGAGLAAKAVLTAIVLLKVGEYFESVGKGIVNTIVAMTKMGKAAKLLKTILFGGLIAAIFLLAEDLYVFYKGGESVTGQLMQKWKPAIYVIIGLLGLLTTVMISMGIAAVATALGFTTAWTAAFLPVAIAIAGLAALAYLIYENWPGVIDFLKETAEEFKAIYEAIRLTIDAVKELLGLTTHETSERFTRLADSAGKFDRRSTDEGGLGFLRPRQPMTGARAGAGGSSSVNHSSSMLNHTEIHELNISSPDPHAAGKAVSRELTRNGQSGVGM